MNNFLQFFLDALFPKNCFGCEKEGEYLCSACFRKIELLPIEYCFLCQKVKSFDGICQTCQEITKIDKIWPAVSYQNMVVKALIENLKFSYIEDLAEILAEFLFARLQEREFTKNSADFFVVPIPLHKKRLRWRGFNQAELLAKSICQKTELPLLSALIRSKKTQQQALLNKEKRVANVEDCFSLSENVRGKKILLLDDVMTTGQTLLSASQKLKEGGAEQIIILTSAHG
ncbi:MAG: phosphoribosyltransferase family protein [Patescibacteria group bacterium]